MCVHVITYRTYVSTYCRYYSYHEFLLINKSVGSG